MDILETSNGQRLELTKSDYPITIVAETDSGQKVYTTEKYKSGKICTSLHKGVNVILNKLEYGINF